jgi:branched-chain amino acid transport system substrate-binding protein
MAQLITSKRTWLIVAALILTAFATVAGATSRATAASKSPIVVGNVGTYSGQNGESGTAEGLQAWARWTNAHGGINGHRVILKSYDDAGDNAKNLAAVQRLISHDHAIVLLNNFTPLPTWQSYANQKGVPTVSANPYYGSGLNFAASTTMAAFGNSLVYANAKSAKHLGFVLCQEFPACKTYADGFKALGEKLGKPTDVLQVLTSTPDFTATCLALRSAGADTVTIGLAPVSIIRMANDCDRQRYHPQWVIGGNTIQPAVTKTPALDGAYSTLIVFPWFEQDTPATREFQAAIRKYIPEVLKNNPDAYNANMAASWAAGKVLATAAKNLSNRPTSKEITQDLLKVKNNSFGGLTPPLTFASSTFSFADPSKYQQPASDCFFKIQLTNGKWAKPSGQKVLQCP